jgi:hypothetical protein
MLFQAQQCTFCSDCYQCRIKSKGTGDIFPQLQNKNFYYFIILLSFIAIRLKLVGLGRENGKIFFHGICVVTIKTKSFLICELVERQED